MVYLLWLFTYIGNMAVWLQCVSVCPIMVFHNILHICSITLHNWRILNFKIYLVFGVWGKESWACVLKHFIYHYLLVLQTTHYFIYLTHCLGPQIGDAMPVTLVILWGQRKRGRLLLSANSITLFHGDFIHSSQKDHWITFAEATTCWHYARLWNCGKENTQSKKNTD